ncbi:MltR family transcriptional regulator [Pseudomonas berkeleyensis]|uniref:Mannitol repressor n=1 Tax=Pseudomonas berkeleyensis TaxID=2726956 RepID=A0A7G5DSS4_9PSED|nr:MltR family transcriptional regulator [Pseudomonas berkeleyensis]QMV64799.1 hypothetical protein HS968_06975 [Pseudomonas berkeleyensis]WSO40268.1 MltR family transcriptional regulator [Pseudomonas berkeleyensis]
MSATDLANESDRGCVLVAAAMLDEFLEESIKERIQENNVSNKTVKSLFDANGPIANFSSKILICRSFGIIDDASFHDLMIVRKLRNTFAHTTNEASFLEKDVIQKVRSMHFVQKCMNTTHKEFLPQNNPTGSSPTEHPKDWELRAKGLLPVDKSMFCTAVIYIQIHILEKRAMHLKENQKKQNKPSSVYTSSDVQSVETLSKTQS